MRSSTLLASCLPLLFRYMLNLFFIFYFLFFIFIFLFTCLSWLLMWEIVIRGTCYRWAHWSSTPPLDSICLWPDGFARECVVPHNPNVMGYPFLPNTQAMSSFSFCTSFSAKFLCLFQSLTHPSLNYNPLSKSMRSWCGWSRISNYRWPTTWGSYTVLEEWPIQVVVVMMMMMVRRRT